LSRKILAQDVTGNLDIVRYSGSIRVREETAMRLLREVCAIGSLLLVGLPIVVAQSAAATDRQSATEIRQLIDTYMQAVDAADPNLAAKVFLTTPAYRSSIPWATSAAGIRLPMRCSCASWARHSRSAR
jgi:hypothetical protein